VQACRWETVALQGRDGRSQMGKWDTAQDSREIGGALMKDPFTSATPISLLSWAVSHLPI